MGLGDGKKKKKGGSVVCPACGSVETGKFIYGEKMPDEHTKKEVERGRIRLVDMHSEPLTVEGSPVDMDPEFYCADCGCTFGIPAIIMEADPPEYMTDAVQSIGFSITGLPGEERSVHVERTGSGARGHIRRYSPDSTKEEESAVEMSETRFMKFLGALFNRVRVHEWKPAEHSGDGPARWKLDVELGEGRRIYYSGTELPPYFSELAELMQL